MTSFFLITIEETDYQFIYNNQILFIKKKEKGFKESSRKWIFNMSSKGIDNNDK